MSAHECYSCGEPLGSTYYGAVPTEAGPRDVCTGCHAVRFPQGASTFNGPEFVRGADISECGKYRYHLWRTWDEGNGVSVPSRVCFVMLNPSTADGTADDPTLRKCTGFAKRWGFGGLDVVNLFAFRSVQPAVLRNVEDPVGPRNDETILMVVKTCRRIVVAWGNKGTLNGRSDDVLALIRKYTSTPPVAIRVTKKHQPAHPLYLPYDLPLVQFKGTDNE